MRSNAGKLLLTAYQNKMLLLQMQDNRLVYAQAFSEKGSLLGNIYIGKVTNVAKNIDAAFVEIFPGQICFLPLKECKHAVLTNRPYDKRILAGDEIIVQVVKEASKTKQPSLTANISFTGTYCVVTSGKRSVGFSGKLKVSEKAALEAFLKDVTLSASYGYVFRTNCRELKAPFTPLLEELQALQEKADAFFKTALHRTCYSLLEEAESSYVKAVMDVYQNEYEEIVTDNKGIYERLLSCSSIPGEKVRFYEDSMLSLQKLYAIETKLSEALGKTVWLKSGGYLVIEPTEALTVIDVNTGKAVGKREPREQYFLTNMEAAEEIARQLKLRNLSGIVIVDFINLEDAKREAELLTRLRTCLKGDAVKTQVIDITPLGLVEITRQKKNPPLAEQMQ